MVGLPRRISLPQTVTNVDLNRGLEQDRPLIIEATGHRRLAENCVRGNAEPGQEDEAVLL